MGKKTSGKICALCREDCSKRRRAKDVDGRYYCLKCFEQRLEEVRLKRSLRGLDDDSDESMSSTFGIDPELIAMDAPDPNAEETDPMVPCPGCGLPLEASAAICVHCGHDFEAGRQIKLRKKVLSREGPMIWPGVVGFLCMAFGALGLVIYGKQFLHAAANAFSDDNTSLAVAIVTICGAALMALLAGVQLIAGFIVWMRFAIGVSMLRVWLWAKLMTFTIVLAAGAIAFVLFPAFTAPLQVARDLGMQLNEVSRGAIVGSLALICLWQCAWPIALLYFFESEQVKKDIKSWDEPLEPKIALYD